MSDDQRPITLHGPEDPETEQRLRDALRREADAVHPGNRLDAIRTQARRGSPPVGRTVLGLVAAALVLVVGGGVLGTVLLRNGSGGGADTAAPANARTASEPPAASSSGSVAPPASATPPTTPSTSANSAGVATGLPVYWIGPGDKLFREFVTVPDRGGRALTAVREMLGSAPADPDYRRGPWAESVSDSTAISVTQRGEDLTVDLPAAAFDTSAPVSRAEAMAAVQQLVWTVTAAVQAQGSVTVLIDGKPGQAWGLVDVGAPVRRDADARSAVWIDLEEGRQVSTGTLTVKGTSRAFEGTVQWTVTRPDGSVAAEGHTMGGSMETYEEFSFTTTLPAGTYLVTVFAPDMSGRARDVGADTKTIVVR